MTLLDDKLAPMTTTILAKLGAAAVFKVVTSGGVYNPATSRTSAAVTTDVSWLITPPEPFSQAYIDGEIIQAGDMRTFLAAQGITFTPLLNQRLTFGGRLWTIVAVEPVYSGTLVCGYSLHLRLGAG